MSEEIEKLQRMTLTTPEFRGSFVNLVRPRPVVEGGPPKFSMMIVLRKDDPEAKQLLSKLKRQGEALFEHKFGKPRVPLQHPITDGDKPISRNSAKVYEELAGCWCFRASADEAHRPRIIDVNQSDVIDESKAYSGAWYRANINAYPWNHPVGGPGWSVGLNSVLFVRDDDPFGGAAADPRTAFEQYLNDEGAGDDDADLFGEDSATEDDDIPF